MKTAFIIHAPDDRAAAEALSAALDRAGVSAATRPLSGDRFEVETLAVRMRRADAAIALVSEAAAEARRFRRDLHLCLLYDRPLVVGRLEEDADVEDLAEDPEIIVGTPYMSRPESLRAKLEGGVFVGVRKPDEEVEKSQAPTPARSLEERLQPLVERVRKEIAVAATEEAGRVGEDALGFPKSPEAMLARWRLIEPKGSIDDFRSFNDDYGDDPYFGPRSAETLAALERRRLYRGAGGVLSWVLGTAAAAALFYGGLRVCADGSCSVAALSGFDAPQIATATMSGGGSPDAEPTGTFGEGIGADAAQRIAAMSADLERLRAESAEMGATLRAANRDRAQAESAAEAARFSAEEAIALRDEASAELEKASAALKAVERRQAGIEAELMSEKERVESLEKEAASLRASVEEYEKSAAQGDVAASEALDRLTAEAESARADIARLDDERARAESETERLGRENEAALAEIARLTEQGAATAADVERLQQDIATRETAIAEAAEALKLADAASAEALRRAEAAEAEVDAAAERAAEAEARILALTSEAKEATLKLAAAQGRVAQLEAAIASSGSDAQTAAAALGAVEERAASLEAELTTAQGRAEDAKAELAAATSRTTQLEAQLVAMEKRAKEAEAVVAMSSSKMKSLETALAAAEARALEQSAAMKARGGDEASALAEAEERAQQAQIAAASAKAQVEQLSRDLGAAKTQIEKLEAALAERGPAPAAAPPQSASAGRQSSDVGAVRLLERIEAGLTAEDARRRETGERKFRRGPVLGKGQLRKLQRCLRDEAGAKGSADGLWGVNTTRALLDLTPDQAEKVADCLES